MVERDLVVASAGDDKKISLWNKNGQSMGSFPSHGSDLADDIEDGKAQLEDCKAIFCITGSLIFTFWKGHFVGGLCYFTYDPTSFRKS
ncbi:uncharacterized protein LOC122025253 isoform X4 [Zingiber officinale]|uniref:uncharacterized protein LOC122025253 isoform X4 n=1 Tax=Zingiber officinale TaxID=94328 RepID=UPI001C4CCCBB|nr:uncharacterized protein LOC122025253 isoform X4 [Zingiber officinale]